MIGRVRTDTLTGGLLDYWTARAQQLQVQLHEEGGKLFCRLHGPLGGRIYRPTEDQDDFTNLAKDYGVDVRADSFGFVFRPAPFDIDRDTGNEPVRMRYWSMPGTSAAEALCRAVVASYYGDTVPAARPPIPFPPGMMRATFARQD